MPFKLNPDLTISGLCKRESIKAFCQSHPNYTSFGRSTAEAGKREKSESNAFKKMRDKKGIKRPGLRLALSAPSCTGRALERSVVRTGRRDQVLNLEP